MWQWIRFFIGSPQRFLGTASGLALVWGFFNPEKLKQMLFELLQAISTAVAPFIEPLLTLAIVFIGLGVILRAVWRKSSGKK